jgi:hypothetical protein
MADNQCIEQRFVGVLEVAKETVLVKRSQLVMEGFDATFDLIVEVADMRRQEVVQVKYFALVVVQSGSLVPRAELMRSKPSREMSCVVIRYLAAR